MNIKIFLAALLFSFLSFIQLKAQSKSDTYLNFGGGVGVEGNMGIPGINIASDLNYYLNKSLSLNPSLILFQSTDFPQKKSSENPYPSLADRSTALLMNFAFQADLLKINNGFRLGLAAGPSYRVGVDNYFRGYGNDENNELVSKGYERISRSQLGLITQLSFDWKGKQSNRKQSIDLSVKGYDNYFGWHAMLTYKMGFLLEK
ncbi:hypothetical protein [Echinicola shivajiensis]|uniref:hypothetical protein n=1 Tax=Echinicola shivajiensis TaxID=1035916 RepID=UPI001BFC55A4|nr:hypothetical protein [Echinicola shivajiensis]